MTGFNRSLVRDPVLKGITANIVLPGLTDTDMNPADGPVASVVGSGMAIGRNGQPAEIVNLIAYLASPEAGFVTGSDIVADGGLTA
jgi:3-oxoacyl-[acyl-carrier protein] reductase